MKAAWLLPIAFTAAAQTADQTSSVSGVVTDAVTHIPVKKTMVSINAIGNIGGRMQPPAATMTDASGAFTVANLLAGQYRLMFQHQNYPQARFGGVTKDVEIKAGETAGPVNMELIPGAAVSGRVIDEDGDPLQNCYVQIHPAKDPNQGVPMMGNAGSDQDGEYRIFGVAPDKYILSVHCGQMAFQARPFSAGPDRPPSRSYVGQFYPLATDAKSAQVIELTAGNEKSGIDFQMTPTAVTQIRGVFSPTGADWHGSPIVLQLNPLDGRGMNFGMGAAPNFGKGTFEFPPVVPGSYMVVAFSQGDDDKRIGAWQRVEVGEKPVEVTLELKHAMELSGKVEIENSANNPNKLMPNQMNVQLVPQEPSALPGSQTQVADDGTFIFKGVLPAPWRLQMNAPFGFIKAAWLGSVDVTSAPLDLSGGAAGALRILVSTNTATIRGSAPAGRMVMVQRVDGDTSLRPNHVTTADQNGQYTFAGLPPGKYRVVAVELPGPMPDEGGQDVTVREGETVTADLKTP